MKLHTIDTGYFKLDGGAMFGVVPKVLWQKIYPCDENNLITWSMRCLLIETGDRLILIDTGIGDKQSEKFFGYYQPHGEDSLDKSLNKAGFNSDDITDVILTHLHFDHCGGAVIRDKTGHLKPKFANAKYWSNQNHWQWAVNPNARERASFLKENFIPIEESGQLNFIEDGENLCPGISVRKVCGHTESMLLPQISYKDKTIIYMADLIPSTGHIQLPYIMAYDIRPLLTLDEKSRFLREAVENNYILFFEHDPVTACCTIKETEKGFGVAHAFPLEDVI